ncbi:MAG: RpiB/LacA/LacB family sugar-phosphate isomerase [Dehalococcoidia bacterium]|nr:RpiB/LacA/LacB family sugar-phosphate isomerase [Dehalococcoidia bacterium]
MRIAVINETSAADRNADILAALDGLGHDVVNAGMKKSGEKPELSYIHTGLMAAVLLNAGTVDFVVGGCGTGQGFLNSVMQYPGVTCGHILTPLDAWLFTQINGGNCISLMLNQGYGWAGEANLKFIFEKLFCVQPGSGYPAHRKGPQRESRELLGRLNRITHHEMTEILTRLPGEVVSPVAAYPGLIKLVESRPGIDRVIISTLKNRLKG